MVLGNDLAFFWYALTANSDLSYLLFAWSWGTSMKPAHLMPPVTRVQL